MTEDEMVGWHHRLSGHEFEQAPGVGDGQESLAFCSPRGGKEPGMAEEPNNRANTEQEGETDSPRFKRQSRLE